MANYYFTSEDKEILQNYFFQLKNNSRQDYENWCQKIKNLPQYQENQNSYNFIFEDGNNLVNFVLSNPRFQNLNPIKKINATTPNWNHQDAMGEHSLFHMVKKGHVFDSYCKTLIKKMNVDTEIRNKNGEYFTHMIFKSETWKSICNYRGDFDNFPNDTKEIINRTKNFMSYQVIYHIESVKKLMENFHHHFHSEIIKNEHIENWNEISKKIYEIMKVHANYQGNEMRGFMLDNSQKDLNDIQMKLLNIKLEKDLSIKPHLMKIKI